MVTRLFAAGLAGELVEYDLSTLLPTSSTPSNGGGIWCLAANPDHTILAAGCEDGCVRLFALREGERPEYMHALERVPGRILGLSWHPDGQQLVASGSKSCLYKFNTLTRQRLHTMRVDTESADTIVWCVQVVGQNHVVSGDSLGNVCFWHWESGTLAKCIRAHQADVLCLATHARGQKVFSSGVDRRILCFSYANTLTFETRHLASSAKKGGASPWEWIETGKRRYHSHDVRSLVWVDAKPFDALFSGGMLCCAFFALI
jgi:U3 small nucleolar RNA-associated protein 4